MTTEIDIPNSHILDELNRLDPKLVALAVANCRVRALQNYIAQQEEQSEEAVEDGD